VNAHATLANGTIVTVEINSREEIIYLDDFEETGVRALVYAHGVVVLEQEARTLGQFRLLDDLQGDWTVYERSGIKDGRFVVKAPDRLRAIGALLATF
jgi:hypothetical protein